MSDKRLATLLRFNPNSALHVVMKDHMRKYKQNAGFLPL